MGVGPDRPDLGLETGPLEPEQRGVLVRVGEPLDPEGEPDAYDKQDADLLDETCRLMDRGMTQEQITEIDRNIAAYREEHRRSKAAREHAARNP